MELAFDRSVKDASPDEHLVALIFENWLHEEGVGPRLLSLVDEGLLRVGRHEADEWLSSVARVIGQELSYCRRAVGSVEDGHAIVNQDEAVHGFGRGVALLDHLKGLLSVLADISPQLELLEQTLHGREVEKAVVGNEDFAFLNLDIVHGAFKALVGLPLHSC